MCTNAIPLRWGKPLKIARSYTTVHPGLRGLLKSLMHLQSGSNLEPATVPPRPGGNGRLNYATDSNFT